MKRILKSIKIIVNSIFALACLLVITLGIVGGGWERKSAPDGHPLYSGALLLLAHRGVPAGVPENTQAAAAKAARLGFKGIEIDLKESVDGHFYLFHDANGRRMFQKSVDLGLQPLDSLKQWPLYYEGVVTTHRVPDLETFTSQFGEQFIFYLDVKRHGNERYRYLADKIADHLQRHSLWDRAVVGSDFLFTAYMEYKYPRMHTVFTGPGNYSMIVYNLIPIKFRPDFMISYAREITPYHLAWLNRNHLMNRRMLYGVNGDNYGEVRKMGIPILLVDYDSVMQADLPQ